MLRIEDNCFVMDVAEACIRKIATKKADMKKIRVQELAGFSMPALLGPGLTILTGDSKGNNVIEL